MHVCQQMWFVWATKHTYPHLLLIHNLSQFIAGGCDHADLLIHVIGDGLLELVAPWLETRQKQCYKKNNRYPWVSDMSWRFAW